MQSSKLKVQSSNADQWTRVVAVVALAWAAALTACNSNSDSGSTAAADTPAPVAKADSTTARTDPTPTANPALRGAAAFVRDTAPWSFDNAPGQIIKTDHFTIYTTCKAPAIMERL